MPRRALTYLAQWLTDPERKPMVIRGARQVGKTWVVRDLAKQHQKQLIELNFEKNPNYHTYFENNDPRLILKSLKAMLGITATPETCLLFLDEIQAVPILLSKLRWFAEELPELAVIAAGSLLDFVLDKHTFSMPVGRITYMHMGPLTFEEFLSAYNKNSLVDYLKEFQWTSIIPADLHQQLIGLMKEFLIVGGMPRAVYSWIAQADLTKINQIHFDLLGSYRDDFAKYARRIPIARLEEMFVATPHLLSKKFVFSRVNKDIPSLSLKSALDLLCKAKIVHKIISTQANGLPLAAELNDKYFKVIFLDVGLVSALLNLNLPQISQVTDINLINMGGISEQITGQLLRAIEPFYISPALYYWVREQKNSNAEIDYLIQQGTEIIPIEVKSGSTGSLKSLHLFMHLKKLKRALRINSEVPSQTTVNTKIQDGTVQYQLNSIPFYLIEQIHRLLLV